VAISIAKSAACRLNLPGRNVSPSSLSDKELRPLYYPIRLSPKKIQYRPELAGTGRRLPGRDWIGHGRDLITQPAPASSTSVCADSCPPGHIPN
jgi:hypothetical protein